MKKSITFNDSFDDTEITVAKENDGSISLTIGNNDVWFSKQDFDEFVGECASFSFDIKPEPKTQKRCRK